MRGVNTFIALILIIVIIVAIGGLAYTFAVGIFNSFQANRTAVTEIVPTEFNDSLGVIKDFVINPRGFWTAMSCVIMFEDGKKIFIEENFPCDSLETGKELVRICPIKELLFISCRYEMR
jgi:hypothetical protein